MAASISDKITKTFSSVNPNVARVTATRTAGGSSLSCDNLAGWPTDTAVHFSTYQIDTSNAVVSGTQIDWKGIVSGDTIGSLTRVAGATDAGSSVGDVVEMNPTASWANDLATAITAEHNQDGTHGHVTATSFSTDTISEGTAGTGVTVDGVLIKDNKIATANAVDNTSVSAGMVVQVVNVLSSAVSTTSTTIPGDNTLPQSTEGKEFMTLSITPKSATNILVIDVQALIATSGVTNGLGALFKDSDTNALAAQSTRMAASDAPTPLAFKYTMVAGTTSEITFKFRAGPQTAVTLTFNGSAGTGLFSTAAKSSIVITEYKA